MLCGIWVFFRGICDTYLIRIRYMLHICCINLNIVE
nr:MAG TPA: hypothetical protein [Caudoviricetes sp.]